jgi:hypothetical protein
MIHLLRVLVRVTYVVLLTDPAAEDVAQVERHPVNVKPARAEG